MTVFVLVKVGTEVSAVSCVARVEVECLAKSAEVVHWRLEIPVLIDYSVMPSPTVILIVLDWVFQ